MSRRTKPAPVQTIPLVPLPLGGSQRPSLLESTPTLDLEELLLADAANSALSRVVREHAVAAELAKHGLTPAARLLFEGPPGTGKTSAAGAAAAELFG